MAKRKMTEAPVTPAKARTMLREDTAHGKPLTGPQKRFFGRIAGGAKTVLKSTQRRKTIGIGARRR